MPLILKKPGVERDLNELFDFIAQNQLEPAECFRIVAAKSFERLVSRKNGKLELTEGKLWV